MNNLFLLITSYKVEDSWGGSGHLMGMPLVHLLLEVYRLRPMRKRPSGGQRTCWRERIWPGDTSDPTRPATLSQTMDGWMDLSQWFSGVSCMGTEGYWVFHTAVGFLHSFWWWEPGCETQPQQLDLSPIRGFFPHWECQLPSMQCTLSFTWFSSWGFRSFSWIQSSNVKLYLFNCLSSGTAYS